MTAPQRLALEYIVNVQNFATPAMIGQAMGGTKSGRAQGLGRLGGVMAHRLIRLGLVYNASSLRRGFPAYRATYAARAMLAKRTEGQGMPKFRVTVIETRVITYNAIMIEGPNKAYAAGAADVLAQRGHLNEQGRVSTYKSHVELITE